MQELQNTYTKKVLRRRKPGWLGKVDTFRDNVASADAGCVGFGKHNDELAWLLYNATE